MEFGFLVNAHFEVGLASIPMILAQLFVQLTLGPVVTLCQLDSPCEIVNSFGEFSEGHEAATAEANNLGVACRKHVSFQLEFSYLGC
jgi:hypothetical protein